MALAPALEFDKLAPLVQRIVGAAAPPPMRMMAARGAAPGLKPEQLVTVVAILAEEPLPHVEEQARQTAAATLAALPPPVLLSALSSPELPAGVVDRLARVHVDNLALLEKIVTHPAVAPSTILHLAATGTEPVTELVAVNEQLLLEHTEIIEALYMNRATRMSTTDRLLDLAVRNGRSLKLPSFAEAAEALAQQNVPPPSVEPLPGDLLAAEIGRVDEAISIEHGAEAHTLVEDDEHDEPAPKPKAVPLDQLLRQASVTTKIRYATLGKAAARALLVRDKNRLVATAVIRSPLVQEQEIATYASSRAVSGDVLREIARNGDFTKSHVIKFNLVGNPKTPIAIALKLLPHLRVDELRKLAKSKNVSSQISKLSNQELNKKKP